ncbi:MAG TPA: carboxypeptidase regulatory-like domain-containing protein [Galbitalea sp.]
MQHRFRQGARGRVAGTGVAAVALATLIAAGVAAPASAATGVDFTVTVTGNTGVPVAGVTVIAEQVTDGVEVENDPAPHGVASTTTGQYVFSGSAQLQLGATYTLRAVVPASSSSQYSQYLGGATAITRAQTFVVGPGAGEVASLGMSLAPGGALQGLVNGPTGKPVSGATVKAFVYDGSSWNDEANVTTSSTGRYTFPALAPGSYKLAFYAPAGIYAPVFSGGRLDLDSAVGTWVTAGQVATAGISFFSYPGGIRGTTQLQTWNYGNAPMIGASVGAVPVTQLDVNGNAAAGDVSRVVEGTKTDSKGAWSIAGLAPGNYAIEVTPHYAVQVGGYIGTGGPIAGAVVFRVGNTVMNAGDNYFYSKQSAGAFSTTLYTPGDTARASGVRVTLQSQLTPTLQYSGTTDSQGSITLGRVAGKPVIPNGPYTLTFIDPLARYEPRSMSITIGNYDNEGYELAWLQSQPGFSVLPTIAQTATEVGTLYTVMAADARPGAVLTYQWLRDGHPIYGSTSSTYRSRLADVGTQLTVRVEASSFGFSSVYQSASVVGLVTLTDVAPTIVTPPSISPSSDNSVHAGTVLHVAAGVWDTPGVLFSYHWFEDGAVVAGASTSHYQVGANDIGHHFSATVTASRLGHPVSDAAGTNTVSPTSGPASTPAAPMVVTSSAAGLPAGSTRYTVMPGQWTGLDPEFHYEWKLGDVVVGTDSPSYITSGSAAELAQSLVVTVDAIVAGFEPGSATVTARQAPVALVATAQPFATFTNDVAATIAASPTSSLEVGQTLTVHPGTWVPASTEDTQTFTYQWMRSTDWSVAAPIAGAISATYTPTVSDLGAQLSFVVTAHSELWRSGSSTVVGVGRVGLAPGLSALTSIVSLPEQSNSGLSITPSFTGAWDNTKLAYQWYGCVSPSCSDTATTRSFTRIEGATSLSYTPPLSMSDSRAFVVVTARRFGSASTELQSNIVHVVGGVLTLPYPPALQNAVYTSVRVGGGVSFGGFGPIAGGDADGESMSWQVCSLDCGSPDADWHAPDGPTQYGSWYYENSFSPDAVDWANGNGYVRAAQVSTKAGYLPATSYSAIQHIDIGKLRYINDPTRHFDATTGTWSIAPGIGDSAIANSVETVQWYVGDQPQPVNDTNSYTQTAADAGQVIFAIDSFSAPGYTPTSDNISARSGTVVGLTASPNVVIGNTYGQPITLSNPIPWDLPDADLNVWTMRYDWDDQTQIGVGYVTATPFFTPNASSIGHVFKVFISATSPDYPAVQTLVATTFTLQAGGSLVPTTAPSLSWSGDLAEGTKVTTSLPSFAVAGVTTTTSWQTSPDDTNWTTIAGATATSYTVSAADQGNWIRSVVTATDAGYITSTSYSEAEQPEVGDAIRELAEPSMSGDASVDGILSADPGAWPSGVATSIQWLLNGNPIPGATGGSYSPLPSDAGNEISVEVIGSAPGLTTRVAESNRMIVQEASAPLATTSPTITGLGTASSPLVVSTGTWSIAGLVFSCQWSDQNGEIAGATSNSLVLPVGDVRGNISVTVTATRYGYADGSAVAH